MWQVLFFDLNVRIGWDLKYQIPLASRPVSVLFDGLNANFGLKQPCDDSPEGVPADSHGGSRLDRKRKPAIHVQKSYTKMSDHFGVLKTKGTVRNVWLIILVCNHFSVYKVFRQPTCLIFVIILVC